MQNLTWLGSKSEKCEFQKSKNTSPIPTTLAALGASKLYATCRTFEVYSIKKQHALWFKIGHTISNEFILEQKYDTAFNEAIKTILCEVQEDEQQYRRLLTEKNKSPPQKMSFTKKPADVKKFRPSTPSAQKNGTR